MEPTKEMKPKALLMKFYPRTYQGDLKRHKKAIHEGVKYACNQCEYHATEQGNLKKHKQSIHEGVK